MALGDEVRRNIANVAPEERELLKKAFIALNTGGKFRYPGKRGDKPFTGGVSYWFKQDEIHQARLQNKIDANLGPAQDKI